MLSVQPVRLRRHATLEPVDPDDVLVTVGMGPSGQAVALWARPAGHASLRARTIAPSWASFPDPHTTDPVAARITIHDPTRRAVVEVPELEIAHPLVQPLPEDRLLVVGARCSWRPEGPDHNAIVVDDEGIQVGTATLGDGIADVRTTTTGDVWVGYFDEGVYGNFGWGGPGPEPIGHPGLIRWTADLRQAWRYPYDSEFGIIDECCALNVDGITAWACHDSDFPIIRIDDDTIDGWRSTISGARALLTDARNATAALVGGADPEHDRLIAGRLDDHGLEPTFTGRLTYDDGTRLDLQTRLIGRGPELNAFHGTTWYKLDLTDRGFVGVRSSSGRLDAPGEPRWSHRDRHRQPRDWHEAGSPGARPRPSALVDER